MGLPASPSSVSAPSGQCIHPGLSHTCGVRRGEGQSSSSPVSRSIFPRRGTEQMEKTQSSSTRSREKLHNTDYIKLREVVGRFQSCLLQEGSTQKLKPNHPTQKEEELAYLGISISPTYVSSIKLTSCTQFTPCTSMEQQRHARASCCLLSSSFRGETGCTGQAEPPLKGDYLP